MAIHPIHRTRGTGRRRTWCVAGAAPLATVVAAFLVGLVVVPPSASVAGAATPPGWTTTQAPLPSDAGTNPNVYTASSTCASTTNCAVVGWYDDTAAHTWGLIETWDGTSWADTQAPEPSNAGTGTNQGMWIGSSTCGIQSPCHAVSCPSTGFCMAVGQYTDTGGHTQPEILFGTGTTWQAFQAPVPSDAATTAPDAYLRSVTCVTVDFCAAVGAYTTTGGQTAPLLETTAFTGTTLNVTAQTAPAPSDANTTNAAMFPANVACASTTSCEAAGSYLSTSGTKGLLLAMSAGAGNAWTAMAAPEPANAATSSGTLAQLFDIACPTTTCTAVGQYQATSGSGFPALAVTGSGSTWTATAPPLPSGAASGANERASLLAISCGSASACDAVGTYSDTNARGQGLIESGSGSTWTATQAPQPGDAAAAAAQDVALQAVSCPTAVFCRAVGFYTTASGDATALVETLSGGGWSALAAPLPSNFVPSSTQSAQARVVTCESADACVVGGWYPDPGNVEGFLDSFTTPSPPPPPPGPRQGYWLVASDGGVFTYGTLPFLGSTGNLVLNAPVVGMAATSDNGGYWFVATDGGIFSYGNAQFYGSRGGQPLNKPIVGMAATPDGRGYWLVASDGGIFTYGDAGFYGSAGSLRLNKPVVGMAMTSDGKGYWLVASDGGIFTYGDATFFGSAGSLPLNKPIVGMAPTSAGDGYWLVASDGGIFTYGNAVFRGSTGDITLNKPVVGMAATPDGGGYWLVATDGGVFNYGDAPFDGSAGSLPLNKPVVGMAA